MDKNFEKHIADCEFDIIGALKTEKWLKSAKKVCGSCQKSFIYNINYQKHIAECDPFDIIGSLITEKSLTGENLTRQIFRTWIFLHFFEFKWYRKLGGIIWYLVCFISNNKQLNFQKKYAIRLQEIL